MALNTKRTIDGKGIIFLSFPWNYFLAGIGLFTIGLLDYFLLGHLIGHPEDPVIGEYLGQGNAVFLGGISFFYTIGLIPCIVGAIMLIYCVLSIKVLSIYPTESVYRIEEMNLLSYFFGLNSDIDIPTIKRISYTNRGMRFRNTWLLLLIPMAVRILQYGIPIFGELRAQDEILPTMMVITAVLDILIALGILLFPNHEVILETAEKNYILNFFPITKFKVKSQAIQEVFQLTSDSPNQQDDLWKLNESNQDLKQFYQGAQKQYLGVIFGGFLILISLIGLSLEFLWGTDLSMVGITYGTYIVLKSLLNDFSRQTTIDRERNSTIFTSYNGPFFMKIGCYHTIPLSPQKIDLRLPNVNLVDIVGIGLLLYLASLELFWSCLYLNIFNGLILVDFILTWIIWIVVVIGIYVYLIIPINYIVLGEDAIGISYPVYHPQSRLILFKEIILGSKKVFHLDQKGIRVKAYIRVIGMLAVVVSAIIVGVF